MVEQSGGAHCIVQFYQEATTVRKLEQQTSSVLEDPGQRAKQPTCRWKKQTISIQEMEAGEGRQKHAEAGIDWCRQEGRSLHGNKVRQAAFSWELFPDNLEQPQPAARYTKPSDCQMQGSCKGQDPSRLRHRPHSTCSWKQAFLKESQLSQPPWQFHYSHFYTSSCTSNTSVWLEMLKNSLILV